MKYSNINPSTSSHEEIKEEIARLTDLMNAKKNEEQAIKIFINSVYGATASPYFVGYNVKIAEAITLQGQTVRAYAATVIDKYFLEFWHKDRSLHQQIGLEKVNPVKKDVSVYGDTDSVYISFENVVKSCDWQGDPIDLIHLIYKHRLKEYLEKGFEKYAASNGTKNTQNLEMETMSYSGIFLKKKKYVLDLAWKDGKDGGIRYDPQNKIKAVGVEIAQSSTPAFARIKLKEILKLIFKQKNNLNMRTLAELLKKEKQGFCLDNIENISMSASVNDYEKGVLDDKKNLVFNTSCPMHVRASGYYNYLINSSKWKNKYQLIKTGDKVRYYYAQNSEGGENVFAYLPGNYPVEVAPPVDYDTQFAKCIIDPINRFILAIGMSPLSPELIVKTQLF